MDTSADQTPQPRTRRRLLVVLAAGAALAGLSAVVVVLAGAGGGSRPARVGSHPAGAASQPAATTHPPASARLPPQVAARVAAWQAGRGGAVLARVSGQLGEVTMSGGIRSYNSMRRACTQLAAAVTSARAGPPIPDAAMQRWYKMALSKLAGAAVNCQAAISVTPSGDEDVVTRENGTLLARAESELATGAKDLYLATARIKAVKLG